MASGSRIKGITIEIDGATTGLQKSLESVTKESMKIQNELKDVERLLKFDPGNVEALAQKQNLLAKQIENTSSKLNQLKEAEQQVEAQFKSGDIGESQYRAFRREISFTETELGKLKQSIAKVDDGSAIKNIKQDLSKIPVEANKAQESVKGLSGELTNLVAGAAAGVGIGKVVEEAFNTSSLNTQIDISFNVPEESVQSVKNAISTVETYGVDAEAALEGVRRQWALNKNASDESNAAVVIGAATIVAAYGDVDFTELIQETNELSKTLGISNEDALSLTYSLLKVGFPPDQLDIIGEYGTQLHNAGYNAQEIQAIMAAGVETGTWNIDVLLDGLKEGRIVLAEFGQGVDKTTTELIQGTSISADQLKAWGKSVANGGEEGKKAMTAVATAIAGIDDKTKQNAVGVKIFGTLWEENGTKITDTILGMNDNLTTAEENQNDLNAATDAINSDPAIQMATAISNLQTAMAPLLIKITELVTWFLNLDGGVKTVILTIGAIVIAIGGFLIIAGQMSIGIAAMTGAMQALTIATIANKFETIAIAALYAKDFILSVINGTAALVVQAGQWALNTIAIGANAIATGASTLATGAWSVVCGIATAATWLGTAAMTAFNLVMTLNPIGLVVIALAALGLAIAAVVIYWEEICEWISKAWDWLTKWNGTEADDKNVNVETTYSSSGVPSSPTPSGNNGIPGFAVGTRYLPQDMLIQAHKGEMIVPKSENPYANSGKGQTMPSGRTQTIIVPVTLDGMNIATVTAPYSNKIQGSNLAFSGRSSGL